MKYWIYYVLALLMLLHPHLKQKLEMLWSYFSKPGYEFWTTFSPMDFFDLLLHGGLPVALIVIGIIKQKKQKK